MRMLVWPDRAGGRLAADADPAPCCRWPSGNLAAIAQTNLKRMLACSAISHMGFMLLGIVTGVVGGDARYALNAYSSAMFYVVTYVLMSAPAPSA